jgi:Rrf2 family protein
MDISKELEYTIIGLIDLAERDVRSTAGEIARHMELPEELIKKIFQKLSKAQIVRSIKGKGGGYELNNNWVFKKSCYRRELCCSMP